MRHSRGKADTLTATARGTRLQGWTTPLASNATQGPDFAVTDRENTGALSLPTMAALAMLAADREDTDPISPAECPSAAPTVTLAGWSTPQARDHKGAPLDGPQDRGTKAAPVNEQVRLATWPTPLAADNRGSAGAEPSKLKELPNCAMLAGWQAPTATDANRGDYQYDNGNPDTPRLSNSGMAKAALQELPTGPFAIRCAVRQTASGPVLTGCCVETLTDRNSGPLNPAHSAWLQGIPAELARCVDTAMRSISMSRRNSSAPSGPK
ncbi:hypothetical protein [Novosphingobium sp. CF614]|uniref:hypothetical protein n=1 Tax=Novosphingobium sp. CF614 TaxID=1884364 RepID=UPI0015A5EADD|nr:hypothetical protein [Novosphingobium sp. CF614]